MDAQAMYSAIFKPFKMTAAVVTAMLAFLPLDGQLAEPQEDQWEQGWVDLQTNGTLAEDERLNAQTDLLKRSIDQLDWKDPVSWERATSVLDGWERSSDLGAARAAYVSLLDGIGWALGEWEEPAPWEPRLREYYQRALKITTRPSEEGRLLFHLARSLYRSGEPSMELRRRLEAYLQQASLALGKDPASAHVHFFLAELYLRWAREDQRAETGDAYPFSKAVFQFRRVLSIELEQSELNRRAQAALQELLEPDLRLQIPNRFLPGNEVRIPLETRNLRELQIEVWSLPWQVEGRPIPIDKLKDNAGLLVYDQRLPVARRNTVDWQSRELRIGSDFPSGWYRLRASGKGVARESLFLVSGLDVALISRPAGDFTLWAVAVESGQPIAAANYHIMNPAGQITYSGTLGINGTAEIVTGGDSSWTEIHVSDGLQPAVLRIDDLNKVKPAGPWVVPATTGVLPGMTVRWAMIGSSSVARGEMPRLLVHLPDAGELIPVVSRTSGSTTFYEATVPVGIESFGPIYLALPSGHRVLLSHLHRATKLPLRIDLSGERFTSQHNTFVTSAPVSVSIFRDDVSPRSAAEFLRVTVNRMERRVAFTQSEWLAQVEEEEVFEKIFRFDESTGNSVRFDLPDFASETSQVPLDIKVHHLESNRLLAESHLVVVPYRALVDLSGSEKIITPGESVNVLVDTIEQSESITRPPLGELVVYREVWESRYIHRKRGSYISESEYAALPERSLLGAAKTDYRLLERARIREESFRLRIDPSQARSFPLKFELPGFYRIEFDGQENKVLARYPGGPLEVWVLPGNQDFSVFRSDKPRLVVETDPTGAQEVLILLDRGDVSLLIDLEDSSGWSMARVVNPSSTGYFLGRPSGSTPLTVCRVIVSGERRTDFLCQHMDKDPMGEWNLGINRRNGLNPGSTFNWDAEFGGAELSADPVWVFYPEYSGVYFRDWVRRQQDRIVQPRHDCQHEAASMGQQLPLLRSGIDLTEASEDSFTQGGSLIESPRMLPGLYPEIGNWTVARADFPELMETQTAGQTGPISLSGQLPESAGRWALTVFSPLKRNRVASQQWILSTELPIRTSLDAPPFLRVGDVAIASLRAENTTRRSFPVEVIAEADGALLSRDDVDDYPPLAPEEEVFVRLPIESRSGGDGSLVARVQADTTSSTAYHEAVVQQERDHPAIQSFVVEPGNEAWSQDIELDESFGAVLHISSGLGSQLMEIWPSLRPDYQRRQALLSALVDWSLAKVQSHHGLTEKSATDEAERLLEQIAIHQSGLGLAWTPASDPDPWLSAIVLWSLETFAEMSDSTFDDFRKGARNYLERVLIDETVSDSSRLFALRTLAAPAFQDPRIRPSRIQARAFLDFLHNRQRLDLEAVAMLMEVARAYHFNEEVRLLSNSLNQRLDTADSLGTGLLWAYSLVYLSMDDGQDAASRRTRVLQAALANLARGAGHISWQQVGGFLNLLAEFLWDGDFSVSGTVGVTLGDSEPQTISLEPHGPSRGHLSVGLDALADPEASSIRLSLNTGASDNPVIVTLLGRARELAEERPFPEQTIQYSREFIEETLLAGSHLRVEQATADTVFLPGETLRMKIEIMVEDHHPHAEFRIAIPAGATLAQDEIEYAHEPVAGGVDSKDERVTHLDPIEPLVHALRVEPLLPGRHILVVPYRIRWEGRFAFPQHKLVLPETGQNFGLGQPLILKIDAAANSLRPLL